MEETQTVTEQKILQVPSSTKSLVEALIFAAAEPLTIKQIKSIYDNPGLDGEARTIEATEIQQIIAELNSEFSASGKPYRIIQIAGGYQFATQSEYAGWLGKLYKEQSRRKLSQSSLETLAMVAYRQPISKPEIESIRGVNCDYVLRALLEKELVTVVGRAETVGRPLLYGTTREFLKHFGLNDITDLPRPREIEEILGESQFETERRMLEAQAGAGQTKKEEEDFKSRLPHIPKKKPELDEPVQIIAKQKRRQINVRKVEPKEQESLSFDEKKEEERAQAEREVRSPSEVESPIHSENSPSNPVVDSQVMAVSSSEAPVTTPELDKTSSETVESSPTEGKAPSVDIGMTEAAPPQKENIVVETATPEMSVAQQEEIQPAQQGIENVDHALPEQTGDAELSMEQMDTVSDHESPIVQEQSPNIDDEGTPQEKASPWQSLKKRIQGFIKKLFG